MKIWFGKGYGETMGGKVLELESERLRAEGKVLGESIGEARGEARGKVIGELQGETRLGVLINRLILDGRSAEVQGAATDAEKRKELIKSIICNAKETSSCWSENKNNWQEEVLVILDFHLCKIVKKIDKSTWVGVKISLLNK